MSSEKIVTTQVSVYLRDSSTSANSNHCFEFLRLLQLLPQAATPAALETVGPAGRSEGVG